MKSLLRLIFCLTASILLLGKTASADVLVKFFELYEGQLAFSYDFKGKTKVYILDFATLEPKPLLKDDLNSENPAWSPDGTKIAFQSNRSGHYELYTVNADGTDLVQLTKGGGDNMEPSWSPDGKTLVFQHRVSKSQSNIFTIDANGQNLTEITKSTKQNISPRFRPNSSQILYVSADYWPGWDLLEIDTKTKKISVLTSGYNSYIEPAFDKSGDNLAYTLESGPLREIWVEQKGSKAMAAVSGAGFCGGTEWMGDDGRMFFMGVSESQDKDGKAAQKPEVFILSTRTRSAVQITDSQGKISHLSWNPTSPTKNKGFSGETANVPPAIAPMPLDEASTTSTTVPGAAAPMNLESGVSSTTTTTTTSSTMPPQNLVSSPPKK